MITAASTQAGPVDVMLDLRKLRVTMEGKSDFMRVWQEIAPGLIGQPAEPGRWLELGGPRGDWRALVLEARGVLFFGVGTAVNVIDIGRNPETRHACKDCRRRGATVFGPFYCRECREGRQPDERDPGDRLCEEHAAFLENKYAAYCGQHLPRCRCHEGCPDPATFECDRCRRPFSARQRCPHPNDETTIFCNGCYAHQFELCAEYHEPGDRRLGKSRCGFPVGPGDQRHGRRLCTIRHARQWQVWGPHWRGVTLCGEHYGGLAHAAPADLLWMLVAAKAPAPFLRGKSRDIYRLRNIVTYIRRRELSWAEMGGALRALWGRASTTDAPGHARENVRHLLAEIEKVNVELPAIEAQLLARVRDFYRPHLRNAPEAAVLAVAVKRVFDNRGASPSYRIAVRVGRDERGSMTRILIGKGGTLVKQLKDALGLQGVDFEE